MSDRAIRSVTVVGGGIVALSAAAAFARTLPHLAVTLIESPLDPRALADRLPGSQPSIAAFHAGIGLDEAELIASGAATWRIGTRYRRWSASGDDWYHFDGRCGPRIGTIEFHHLWARAARSGGARPYHAYAMAGVLAAADKFVLPVDDPASPFASYDYSLRLVPDRYREVLARHCDRLRVARMRGAVATAAIDDTGAIGAVVLDDGRRVASDLYVDCGGPAAPLLAHVGGRFEDWARYLPPCLVTVEPSTDSPAASDEVERTPDGWSWRSPGAAQGRVVAADDAAVAPATAAKIAPGRQCMPWRRNVVAIGDAAAAFDPLGWSGLPLAHAAILRALALLPDRDFHRVELAEYNRRTALATVAARDIAALFHHGPGAPQGAFWRHATALDLPERAFAMCEQFRRRGGLSASDDDGIGRDGLIAALIGLGHIPDQIDALASAVPPAMASDAMKRWADALAAPLPDIAPYGAYLATTLNTLRSAR